MAKNQKWGRRKDSNRPYPKGNVPISGDIGYSVESPPTARQTNKLSDRALHQFEAIRRSGYTNMLDRHMVQRIAFENKFYALVSEMEDIKYGDILRNYDPKDVVDSKVPKARKLKISYSLVDGDRDDEE